MEQEKPLAGRCSTWIDDEIDAMGLDVPDDMRPGCCVRCGSAMVCAYLVCHHPSAEELPSVLC